MGQEPGSGPHHFISNFCIALHLRGRISTDDLRRALDRIRPRHVLLIPGVKADQPERAHFALRVLEDCGDQDWVEVVKEELRIGFPGPVGPFARFTLLRRKDRCDLLGTFNHGTCDGFSGIYVMRDLVRLLGEPDADLPALPVPPPVSALLPEAAAGDARLQRRVRSILRKLRFGRSLRRLQARLLPRPAARSERPVESAGTGLPASQRFCILTHTLTAPQTSALVERSRAEGTTVHAAVCAAWLRAFAAQAGDRQPRRRWISSPVNLRTRLARPVDETVGMFLTTIESPIDCSARRDFWEVARRFKKDLSRASTDDKVFVIPVLFNTLFSSLAEAEIVEMARAIFDRPVRYDFSITNMGRIDIPLRIGKLEVEGLHNVVNASEYERTVGVNTFGERMTFIFALRESRMDPAAASLLMRAAIDQLALATGW